MNMKNLLLIMIFALPQVYLAQIISVGSGHVVLKCENGETYTSGNNYYGQQGQGASVGNVFSFSRVSVLDSVKAGTAGGGHVLIVTVNGQVWSWGQNDAGQLGIGNYVNQDLPWVIDTLNKIIYARGGKYHSLFLKSDSSVWGCGDNALGAVGYNTPPYSFNKPVKIDTLKQIIKVSAGSGFSLALEQSGKIWAFGQNYWGQLGNGLIQHTTKPELLSGIHSVIDIDAGSSVSYAITSDGKVWGWGRNMDGELGNAVPRDNTPHPNPVIIPGISNAVQVEAGYRYALALLKNGTVMAWGRNKFYELGDSTSINRYNPVKVKNLKQIHSISANVGVAFAVDSSGQIFSWGYSPLGALASGMDTLKPVPTQVNFTDCNPLVSLTEKTKPSSTGPSLYPNPTSGPIHWPANTSVQAALLMNLNGQVLLHQENPASLNIDQLPDGLYFLKVKTEAGWSSSKIIKH